MKFFLIYDERPKLLALTGKKDIELKFKKRLSLIDDSSKLDDAWQHTHKGAHTPRAVEQAGRQAGGQGGSVSHTLGAVNSISTCLFPIESGCV